MAGRCNTYSYNTDRLLESQIASPEEAGPVYDVLFWHDGQHWRTVVDQVEEIRSGTVVDLSKHEPMADFR